MGWDDFWKKDIFTSIISISIPKHCWVHVSGSASLSTDDDEPISANSNQVSTWARKVRLSSSYHIFKEKSLLNALRWISPLTCFFELWTKKRLLLPDLQLAVSYFLNLMTIRMALPAWPISTLGSILSIKQWSQLWGSCNN